MKIAFFTYPSAFQNIGGGEIQLLKTREYLEKEAINIDLFEMWKSKIEDYDLLHVFGSVKDCLGLVRVAKKRNVKVAISPVFWSDFRRALFTEGGLRTRSDLFIRHLLKVLFPVFPSARRSLFLESDLILPNSEMEKEQLVRLFSLSKEKIKVVYNGVDEDLVHADPSFFKAKYGVQPFILSSGRIEPRKNQLNLIRAIKNIPNQKLILIGSPVSGYEEYYKKCRYEGESFTTFIPTLEHSDPLFRSAYAACELYVLPGWFETPGLVALEAALAGSKVVATKGGSTIEYFKDLVQYIDPANIVDIQLKIAESLKKPKNDVLKEHILKNFTWTETARATAACYRALIR